MSRAVDHTAFPSEMQVKLRRIRWRQVGLAVVRAVVSSASVLIVAMFVAMLADWWFTIFHPGVRTALTVTALLLSAAVLLTLGVRPVIEVLGWTRAAKEADAEVPQLEERWTTVSHFAKSQHQPTTSLSQAMLQQVTSEAVALGSLVEPARVVRVGRLRRVFAVAAVCAALMLGFLAINWEQNSVLFRRFWAPTAQITATQLKCVTGDVAVPRGQTIEIVTRLSGVARPSATMMLVTGSNEAGAIVLDSNPDAPRSFSHHVSVDESFRYRVRAGDSQTAWHSITAIDPPELSDVRLTVTSPDYVGRPPYVKSLFPGRVKAIQGSRLTLEMRAETELQRFELLLTREDESGEASEKTLELTLQSDGWYRFETVLEQDLALSPTLFSPFGLTNEDRRVCRIHVIPDKAPVAHVISPKELLSVSPDDVIDIKFEAHDDHGIAKAELVVYEETEDGEQKVLRVDEIPLDDQKLSKHLVARAKLDLSQFELDEGTDISYAVRVTDNRMLNLDPDDDAGPKRDEDATTDDEPEDNEAADGSLASSPPEATDDEKPTARTEANSGTPDVAANESVDTNAAPGEADPHDTSDAATSVVESDQEDLRVDEAPAASVAKADAPDDAPKSTEADKNTDAEKNTDASKIADALKKSNAEPIGSDDPAASQADAPLPGEPSASPAALANAEDDDASATTEAATAPKTSAKPESPAVAANADKPTADPPADGKSPTAAAPNPAQPGNTDPQLAQNTGNGSPKPADPATPQEKHDPPTETDTELTEREPSSPTGSVQLSEAAATRSSTPTPPVDLPRDLKFESQRGQNTESNRMRLKIAQRLAVVAEPGDPRSSDAMNTRDLLQKLDKELAAAETTLFELNEDLQTDRLQAQSKHVSFRLDQAELVVAKSRKETKETKYEFVGLQLLDIGRTHITPARDRMFALSQDPGSNADRKVLAALHHTSAARELIEALTRQFEEVARERELADALEEVAEIYEVYVENMQNVLREAQQNQNPLERKMGIVEVDEAYLERYADVLEMRRELMAEFGRILGDDPRLMGKYMDLIKRRDSNLRNQLTELRERQEDISTELSGWLRIDEVQKPDVWIQVAGMRLLAAKPIVKEALQLETRTRTQLPLNLDPQVGTAAEVVRRAKEVALAARQSSVKARELLNDNLQDNDTKDQLAELADQLAHELFELDAAFEQLLFEQSDDEETEDFVTRRLAESQGVAEQAITWAEVASHVQGERYHGLAAVDQDDLAVETDRLRIAMSTVEAQLGVLFRPDEVPPEVTNIVRELMMVMETVTFHQSAATYELNNTRLEEAETQQTMATEGFARAEELFDKLRRTSAAILDERQVDDPNISELEDPTLDEFLERLEREPNVNRLLGIPNRPSNLRVMRDWMLWQAQGQGTGESAAQQAAANAKQRAQQMARRQRNKQQDRPPATGDSQLTEDELKKFASAEQTEEEMEKLLKAIQARLEDSQTSQAQRKELQKNAEMLTQMLQAARGGELNQKRWQQLAEADEMKALLEALAKGEPVPDSHWNRLLSTLDAGLWQVRGRTPPEDYRGAIEQYQNQIRRLLNAESIDEN